MNLPSRLLGAGALAVQLAGCAHVPLGTMWEMRNASPRDLVGLDPAGLRAVVSVPDGWHMQPAGHVLEIGMKVDGGAALDARVPLDVEVSLRESKDFDAIEGAHWHVLKIAGDGAVELAKAQAFIAGIPEGSHGSFTLSVTPALQPDAATKALFQRGGKVGKLSVGIRYAPERDWLLLVDGYPLKVDAPTAGAKP